MKSLLEEAIEAWEDTRNGLVAEAENMAAERALQSAEAE